MDRNKYRDTFYREKKKQVSCRKILIERGGGTEKGARALGSQLGNS